MTPPPQRVSGAIPNPASRSVMGGTVEAVRIRVLAKLSEKLDPTRLRRMPPSIMQQEMRRTVEQLVEAEGAKLGRLERDLLIEDLFRDAVGFGPLEELFRDPGIKEILILDHQTVLSRRDRAGDQGWLPTSVKFRDADHLKQVLDKATAHAEPLSTDKSAALVDGKLANGFRVVAVIPPTILNIPSYVVFLRGELPPGPFSQPSGTVGTSSVTRTPAPTPAPPVANTPRPAAVPDTLSRLRLRITQHILSRLASLGVSDTTRLDPRELQRAITAYVQEFCEAEGLQIGDANTARLVQEILTAIRSTS